MIQPHHTGWRVPKKGTRSPSFLSPRRGVLAGLVVASVYFIGVGPSATPAQDNLPPILHSTLTCYSPPPATHPTPTPPPSTTDPDQRLAIPSYFYPDSENDDDRYWTLMETNHPTVGLAIINPDSGPSHWSNPDYVRQVVSSKLAGLSVLGYVSTDYGARSTIDVKCEVDRYYSWYGVDGIFLDEASTDATDVPYYQEIYDHVKAKTGQRVVVINPGTQTDAAYMDVADIIVNFEGSYAEYDAATDEGWGSMADRDKFWHLIYATSKADMPEAIRLSKLRNAGWVYVTDDVLNNPWDTLPPDSSPDSYWSDLVKAAAEPLP